MATDTPRFPRVTGDLEESASPKGPRGVLGRALFKTFIQPSVDQVAWKARQFGPKQMAFNLLSASPLGQKVLDLKGNYDYIKDPNRDGFSDKQFEGGGATPNNASNANSGSAELRTIVATMQTTMSSMVEELKNIRRAVDSAHKTTSAGTSEQTQTKNKVSDLVELFRAQMRGDKAGEKEKRLGAEGPLAGAAAGANPESKTDLIGMLTGLISNFMGKFRMSFLKGFGKIGPTISRQFARITGALKGMFKGLKIPKIPKIPAGLGKLGSSLAKLGSGLTKALGPLGGIIKGVARIGGRFAIVTTVIMAAIDGIMGFFKGWGDTEGPIWKKLAGGLDGAMQGILKGLLEIPKIILQLLKGAATGILELLGFEKLAKQLKSFDLGEWWNKTIGGLVDKFDPVKSMVGLGESLVKTFLDICSFIVKKLTGADIDLNALRNKGNETETAIDPLAGSPTSVSSIGTSGGGAGNAFAPSGGLNAGQGRVNDNRRASAQAMDAVAMQGLSPALMNAVVHVESRGNPNAVSPKGAKGRWQVMDDTNRDPGYGVRPAANNSPAERERVGRDYLTALYRHYGGDTRKALAAYNGGPGRVDSAVRRAERQGGNWLSYMPAETQNYVPSVLSAAAPQQRPQTPNPAVRQPPATPPRVDNNTQQLRRTAAETTQPVIQPANITNAPTTINNVNSSRTTIAQNRPSARDPASTPVGVRV